MSVDNAVSWRVGGADTTVFDNDAEDLKEFDKFWDFAIRRCTSRFHIQELERVFQVK
jgi:hypothetical protein